ncbi:hypothetical protein KHC33_00980 [Methanospirillum sp. J.3.6.1-F.2.7.3]|uniref:Uncharacterized protein n=1 Tax=Methanospirillum purgamenti TaxID=2834276 RepID=A0A8E7AYI9_9EURY|nr:MULTISPECIES: hypothetical protein [Methanospirillum]MDX8551844.1 hypothetical protein [Methanospirillum hungatei]QVV89140.1 hypothetical protein KHC33_00980 [Methanospirillum sp. J.3.6.1-F.2.7.3]
MHLTISHIREIQQYSEKPILGFILYALFYAYNIFGSLILHFHKYTRKTKIDPSAIIHPSACISPWGVVIDKNVKICEKSIVKAHTTIQPGVTIHDQCVIGDTGFQIYRYRMRRLPIIHTGSVIIANEVEVGEKTCIDRAVFGKITFIDSHTRIGNNVKVGHNIRIGAYCVINDDVAIGGNSNIGDHVHIGKQVAISNRIIIGSNNTISPGIVQTRDLKEGYDDSL